MQGGDVLLEREFLDALDRFRLQCGDEAQVAAFALFGQLQVRLAVGQHVTALVADVGFAEADRDALAVARDACVADVLVAEQAAQVGSGSVEPLGERPFMSTCSRKCTPPRRSRPRYIGRACMPVSHFGEADSRLSAITYCGSCASGLNCFSSKSFAFSWVSVSLSRTLTPLASRKMPSWTTPAVFSVVSTRSSVFGRP